MRWTPGNALLHFDLAIALKQMGPPDSRGEALRHFERALTLFRTHPPPEVANLAERFQQGARMEIAHLTGRSSSWMYVMQQVALGVRDRATELSLFILVFAGIAAYLLRAGMRLSGPGPGGTYPIRQSRSSPPGPAPAPGEPLSTGSPSGGTSRSDQAESRA